MILYLNPQRRKIMTLTKNKLKELGIDFDIEIDNEDLDKLEQEFLEDGKPYPNEHAARIENPDKYDSFRRQNDKFGKGIHAIWGIIKGPPRKSELQSIRFNKNKFTVAQAKEWLKGHDIEYIKFEPASEASLSDEIEHKQFSIEEFKIDKTDDGAVTIEGYANTKGKKDRYGDVPTVFSDLRDYVYELKDYKKNPIVLLDHWNSTNNIAGSFNPKMGGFIKEDEKGLKFKLVFSKSDFPPVAHARTVYEEGHGRALSIGGKWHHENKDHPEHLTYAEIFEISLVGVGADPNALTIKSNSDLQNEKGKVRNLQDQIIDLGESIKAGRVLSKSNEDKIRQAQEMLATVLKSLDKEKEEDKILQEICDMIN